MFGHPRKLVIDATRRLGGAVKTNRLQRLTKFVLMNTAGNSNRELTEPISFTQKCVIEMLRFALPPHVDNEAVADYLRSLIDQNDEAISVLTI